MELGNVMLQKAGWYSRYYGTKTSSGTVTAKSKILESFKGCFRGKMNLRR
jgi:hypothetical protein